MGNCLSDKNDERDPKASAASAAPPEKQRPSKPTATGKENAPVQPNPGNVSAAPASEAQAPSQPQSSYLNKTDHSAPDPTMAKPGSVLDKPQRTSDVSKTRVFSCPINVSSEHSGGGTPTPIRECCRWILKNGLAHEGLFRIPGRKLTVNAYIDEFDYDPYLVIPDNEDVDNVCSIIINYLKLVKNQHGKPGHLWESYDGEFNMQKELVTLRRAKTPPDAAWVKHALTLLAPEQVAIFRELTHVLLSASAPEHMETNRMNPYNFAMCTLPTIMAAVEIMIEQHDFVFGDDEADGLDGLRGSEASQTLAMSMSVDPEDSQKEILQSIGEAQHAVNDVTPRQ